MVIPLWCVFFAALFIAFARTFEDGKGYAPALVVALFAAGGISWLRVIS